MLGEQSGERLAYCWWRRWADGEYDQFEFLIFFGAKRVLENFNNKKFTFLELQNLNYWSKFKLGGHGVLRVSKIALRLAIIRPSSQPKLNKTLNSKFKPLRKFE